MKKTTIIVPCAAVGSAFLLFTPDVVRGDLPSYATFELQVRSNLCVNEGPEVFNLNCDSFFTSGTPTLNNAGQVAIRLNAIGGTDSGGVWFGAAGGGGVVYTSPAGALVSDTVLNHHGRLVFPQTFSAQNGVYFYDAGDETSGLLTNAPLGSSGWSAPQINDQNDVAYRASFFGAGQIWYSRDAEGNAAIHAAEVANTPGSPYSFLFTPSFNNERRIAGKVRLAGVSGNADQIRIFGTDGSSVLIADTSVLDSNSPFSGFDNSVSLNDHGQVAFIANRVGGGRGVYVGDGDEVIEIATTDDPDINVIEFFAPSLNNHGLVAFRIRDGENLYAIAVGNGERWQRVIGQFDPVPTDLGPGQIARQDTSPVFGGGVAINDHGDIAFNASLKPEDTVQIEWGSGVFIASADRVDDPVPGDLNGDGVVDVFDLLILLEQWGICADPDNCPADLNDDGVVDVFDLLALLENWG